jgi:ribosomal subunit interface protein
MKTKIAFHNMPHSEPLEAHANQKLQKVLDLFSHDENINPFFAEFWLKANKQHPHHATELHVKTPHMDLHAHDEGPDLYIAIDNTIDKMIALIKKEKEKFRDKVRKLDTEKKQFSNK